MIDERITERTIERLLAADGAPPDCLRLVVASGALGACLDLPRGQVQAAAMFGTFQQLISGIEHAEPKIVHLFDRAISDLRRQYPPSLAALMAASLSYLAELGRLADLSAFLGHHGAAGLVLSRSGDPEAEICLIAYALPWEGGCHAIR